MLRAKVKYIGRSHIKVILLPENKRDKRDLANLTRVDKESLFIRYKYTCVLTEVHGIDIVEASYALKRRTSKRKRS